MKRVLVVLITCALLLATVVAGLVLLRQDRPEPEQQRQTCERLSREVLPEGAVTRTGDRLGLLEPGSGAERVTGERVASRWLFVGDPGVGQVAAAFRLDGCDHTVWWPAGTRSTRVRAWLRDF